MHLNDGDIRTYLDGVNSQESRSQIEAHLADCQMCRHRKEYLAMIAGSTAGRLAGLAPSPIEAPASVGIGRSRLQALMVEKEKIKMNKGWNIRYRPALIASGLLAILVVSMAFAPVRAIANSFLGLFRVQQLQVVEVNPGNLPEQLGSSYQLEYFISNNIQYQQQGEDQIVANAAVASSLAGIPVRLPPGMNGKEQLVVTSPAQITFTVQLEQMRALLDEIGRADIRLPEDIDGAVVTVNLPSIVSASYGDCTPGGLETYPEGYDPDDPTLAQMPDCTTLVQMSSPEVNAPEGLDLTQLGQAYLQLMGMAPDEAEQFSQNIDWASTLVVPIPVYEASYQEVEVNGVKGTLIFGNQGDYGLQYMLIWIEGDLVYVLSGPGGAATAVRLAESLR